MAFPLLAAAAIGAVGAGIGAYGKYKAASRNTPMDKFKQKAFKQKANTGYLKRYMADLRGRSGNRARTELAMRPALRAIGAQQQQGQRQLAYQSAQQGLEGSGIEAQKQLTLQQGTTQAVAGVGEKVLNQQLTQARQMQAQKEGQRMKLAGEIGRQEGAVAQANRLSEFRTTEANRQADFQTAQEWEQYDRNLKNIKTEGWTNVAKGALKGASPFIMDEAGYEGETRDILGYKGGGLVKGYQGGGDVVAGLGTGYTAEEELKNKRQTEFDTATTEFGTKKTDFETAEVARKKQIEDANILADQQFELAEQKKETTRGFEEARQQYDTEQFYKTEDEERQAYAAKYGKEIRDYKIGEKERIAALTGGTTPDQLAFTEHRKATEEVERSPEYFEASKKAEILNRWSLGDKQFAKAGKQYEKVKDNFESFEDYLDQVTKDPNANVEDLFGKGITANKKKRMLKKYNKKMDALLPKFEPTGTEEDIQAQITEGEEPTYEFEEGEAPADLPKYEEGVAPTKQEYTAKEFAEEAPTLQEPTEKEIYALRKKEIKKQLRAGIDVKANIATAKTNREAVSFYKNVENMTTDQIWADPFAMANPAKVATYISKDKKAQAAEDKQYARTQVINEVIQAGNVKDDLSTPGNERDMAMADVLNSEAFINADPTMQMQILNETQQQRNAIARDNAKDVKLADKFSNEKNKLNNMLHVMGQLGEGSAGQRMMAVLNKAGNEENMTSEDLETFKTELPKIDFSGTSGTALDEIEGLSADVKALIEEGRVAATKGEKDKFALKVLNMFNKEEFRRDEKQLAQTKTKVPGF